MRVRITGSDELTLEVHASLVARLDAPVAVSEEVEPDADEADEELAAPLTLAIEVDGTAAGADLPGETSGESFAEAAAPTA